MPCASAILDAHHPSAGSPNIPDGPLRATSSSPSGHVISFLDLPGEIRNKIYEHAIKDTCEGSQGLLQLFGYRTERTSETQPEDGFERVLDLTSPLACNSQWPSTCLRICERKMLKSALRLYRLGHVSCAVRREFLSILLAGVRFHTCRCGLQDLARGRQEASGFQPNPPLSFLRGNMRALVVNTHCGDRYGPRVAWLLGKVLPTLQFKGQLSTIGTKMHVEIFSNTIPLVTAAFLAGKEDKKANDELKKSYFDSYWLKMRPASMDKSGIMSPIFSVDFSSRD